MTLKTGGVGASSIVYTAGGGFLIGGNTFRFTDRAVLGLAMFGDPGESRLVNCSVRSMAGSGEQTLIVGFNVVGSGVKPVLIRGVGPSLAAYGVVGALGDPSLTVYNSANAAFATNNDWAGDAAVGSVAAKVGAFPLGIDSKDAAVVATLAPGSYSAHTTANGPTGVALVEVYDANTTMESRLANMSARTQVGTGENVLILGFVVDGTAPKRLLVRGVGPTLQQFGVSGALLDPQLQIFDHASHLLMENNDWGGGTELSSAFAQVGAFGLPAGSRDAAMILTLTAGNYSAQVAGANGTAGVGLIEIYELP